MIYKPTKKNIFTIAQGGITLSLLFTSWWHVKRGFVLFYGQLLDVSFKVDSLSLLFLLVRQLGVLSSCLYLREGMQPDACLRRKEPFFIQDKKIFRTIVFLQIILLGVFCVHQLIVFSVLLELSIFPIAIIMLTRGKRSQRYPATAYLIFYTILSGVSLLVLCFWIQQRAGNLENHVVFNCRVNVFRRFEGFIRWRAIFIPLATKSALMPFHSWLPEAHVEASTEGSILLSAVILKLGLYGILRFIPLMLGGPAVELMQKRLPFLALGALAAACSIQLQPDIKKIIAYSSVLHRTCGVAALFRATSLAGVSACYGALSHGVISAGLFLSVGMLQEKLRAREIGVLWGLWQQTPRLAMSTCVLIVANAGFPGTLGFYGEILQYASLRAFSPLIAFPFFIAGRLRAVRFLVFFLQVFRGSPLTRFSHEIQKKSFSIALFWKAKVSCILLLINVFKKP